MKSEWNEITFWWDKMRQNQNEIISLWDKIRFSWDEMKQNQDRITFLQNETEIFIVRWNKIRISVKWKLSISFWLYIRIRMRWGLDEMRALISILQRLQENSQDSCISCGSSYNLLVCGGWYNCHDNRECSNKACNNSNTQGNCLYINHDDNWRDDQYKTCQGCNKPCQEVNNPWTSCESPLAIFANYL